MAEMVFGYWKEAYEKYALSIPIRLNVADYSNVLLTGSSGSGKSSALLFLIGKLLQCCPDIKVCICDFKKSEDFSFLDGYSCYFSGNDCYKGVMEYYRKFSETRESMHIQNRYLLVFDEYPAFLNYLQMKDKAEKTKRASDVLCAVAEILMMGRGISFGLWVVTQRADSTLFSNGSRDNFMALILLGRPSKEQKGMLLQGQEVPDMAFQKGEGVLLADGKGIIPIKYPLIKHADVWKERIRQILAMSDGQDGLSDS